MASVGSLADAAADDVRCRPKLMRRNFTIVVFNFCSPVFEITAPLVLLASPEPARNTILFTFGLLRHHCDSLFSILRFLCGKKSTSKLVPYNNCFDRVDPFIRRVFVTRILFCSVQKWPEVSGAPDRPMPETKNRTQRRKSRTATNLPETEDPKMFRLVFCLVAQ